MKFGVRQISSVILNSREKLEKIIEKMNAIKQTKKWTLVIFYAFLSLKSKKNQKKPQCVNIFIRKKKAYKKHAVRNSMIFQAPYTQNIVHTKQFQIKRPWSAAYSNTCEK